MKGSNPSTGRVVPPSDGVKPVGGSEASTQRRAQVLPRERSFTGERRKPFPVDRSLPTRCASASEGRSCGRFGTVKAIPGDRAGGLEDHVSDFELPAAGSREESESFPPQTGRFLGWFGESLSSRRPFPATAAHHGRRGVPPARFGESRIVRESSVCSRRKPGASGTRTPVPATRTRVSA